MPRRRKHVPTESSLESTRTTQVYRARLHSCLNLFLGWAAFAGHSVQEWTGRPEYANQLLVDYIQHVHDEGQNIWIARHAVLAVQTIWRPLKGQLKRAWDCIASWQMELPLHNRLPLPGGLLSSEGLLPR